MRLKMSSANGVPQWPLGSDILKCIFLRQKYMPQMMAGILLSMIWLMETYG